MWFRQPNSLSLSACPRNFLPTELRVQCSWKLKTTHSLPGVFLFYRIAARTYNSTSTHNLTFLNASPSPNSGASTHATLKGLSQQSVIENKSNTAGICDTQYIPVEKFHKPQSASSIYFQPTVRLCSFSGLLPYLQ